MHHKEHNRSAALRRSRFVQNTTVLMRIQIRIHGVRHCFVQRQPEDVVFVADRNAELSEVYVEDAALVEAERAESNVTPVVILCEENR